MGCCRWGVWVSDFQVVFLCAFWFKKNVGFSLNFCCEIWVDKLFLFLAIFGMVDCT